MTATTVGPAPTGRGSRYIGYVRRQGGFGLEFLVSLLISAGMWANVSGGVGKPWTPGNTALWFGIGALIAVIISDKRGGQNHGNTLVTTGAAVAGQFPFRQVPKWFLAQLLAYFVTCPVLLLAYNEKAVLARYAAPFPLPVIPAELQFGMAVVSAFLFVLLVLVAGAVFGSTGFWAIMKAFIIAFLLLFPAILQTYFITGGGMNTARDLGPMLWIWKFAWWPVVGEIVGAVLAGSLFRVIKRFLPQ